MHPQGDNQDMAVPPTGSPENPILAAGVLLWQHQEDGPKLLLLRNTRHQTWGFAKGHLEPMEDAVTAALRETLEETGVSLQSQDLLEDFADTSIYEVKRGFKRVFHFLAAQPSPKINLSSEHDDCGWFSREQALAKLEHQALRRTVIRAFERLQQRLG